jgi:hypothetical protein
LIDILPRLPNGYVPRYPFASPLSDYSPFFIIGSGRSGNTLLRKLLMENSRVVIPPEIPGLGSTIRKFTQVAARPWQEAMNVTVDYFRQLADIDVQTTATDGAPYCYNLKEELNIDFDQIKSRLMDLPMPERSLAAIITEIYQAFSQRAVGDFLPWGDKTPWNVFHFDRLRKVYPQARYIHMLRDGRDCVVSYVDSLGALMNLDYEEAAYRWRDSIRQADRIQRTVPGNFLEIRYEEMTSFPEATVQRVLDFLNLEPCKNKLISPEDLGDAKSIHHKHLGDRISTVSVGRWKRSLPQNEINTILKIIGKDLMKKGYL